MFNHTTFFAYARKNPFGGRLTEEQVNGMKMLLWAWEKYGDGKLTHIAYIFAGVFHETGGKMVPVRENLTYTSAARIRAVWPSRFANNAAAQPYVRQPRKLANFVYGKRNGNKEADDGWLFRGTGRIQNTFRGNIEKAEKRYGGLLFDRKSEKIDDRFDAIVTIRGHLDGLWRNFKLSDFDKANGEFDARAARNIVNGTDKAGLIADYYVAFLGAFKAAQEATPPADVIPEEAEPDKPKLVTDPTTIGAVIAGGSAIAGSAGELFSKINNPWAFGALVFALAGLGLFFWGRTRLARHGGV